MAKRNARLALATRRLKAALAEQFETKLQARSGTITSVEYGPSGPLRAEVAFGGGASVTVIAAGRSGVERGAAVRVVFRGSTPLLWDLTSARSAAGSGTHGAPLSTPAIDSVTTLPDFGPSALSSSAESLSGRGLVGNPVTPSAGGFALVRAIPEHLAGSRIIYDLEIVDSATGALAVEASTSEQMMTRGVLGAGLVGDLVEDTHIELASWSGLWHPGFAVATLGDIGAAESEHVWVVGPPRIVGGSHRLRFATGRVADLYGVRGYQGTLFGDGSPAAEEWSAGTRITLNSAALGFSGLATGRDYQARARARAVVGGQSSGWSEWFDFTTATDTTAPGWSGDNTPTVEAEAGAFVARWPAADVEASDLARYEVGVSPDGSTWAVRNAGNATLWVEAARPGQTRYFRVRAVDTSGNASAWSASASATMPQPGEPSGANLLGNPTFVTNTTGWTLVGGATFTRDASIYQDKPGSAKLTEARELVVNFSEIYADAAVSGALVNRLWLGGYIQTDGAEADDFIGLELRFYGAGSTFISSHVAMFSPTPWGSSQWRRIVTIADVPPTAVTARAVVTWTTGAGSGTPSLWADNLRLTVLPDGLDTLVTHTELVPELVGAEPALGLPGGNGYALVSSADGARSWVDIDAVLAGYGALAVANTWTQKQTLNAPAGSALEIIPGSDPHAKPFRIFWLSSDNPTPETRKDIGFGWGYNHPPDRSEVGIGYSTETYWTPDGGTTKWVEHYLQIWAPTAASWDDVRPWFLTLDRDTGGVRWDFLGTLARFATQPDNGVDTQEDIAYFSKSGIQAWKNITVMQGSGAAVNTPRLVVQKLDDDSNRQLRISDDGSGMAIENLGTASWRLTIQGWSQVAISKPLLEGATASYNSTAQGWWGADPVAQSTGWSATGTTTKTLTAGSATTADVAAVLATLINQLKTYGLLGA